MPLGTSEWVRPELLIQGRVDQKAVSLFAVLPLAAAALTAVLILFPSLGVAVVGSLFVATVYSYMARRLGLALGALLLISMAALLLPTSVRAVAEVGLAALAFGFTLRSIYMKEPGRRVAMLALSTVLLWVALALNPNVPSVGVALLGIRKSTMVFIGIALGAAFPLKKSHSAGSAILLMLSGSAVFALILHIVFPSLESSLLRRASVYTGQFAGTARMQGMFSGPFHVSLLGVFLILAGWQRILFAQSGKTAAVLMALIGLPLVVLSQVRAGLLACFAGIAFLTLFARAPSGKSRRAVGIAVLLAVVVLAIVSPLEVQDPALRSLTSIQTDQRALSRLETWRESIDLFVASPLYGWGPGSAGDTLGPFFHGARHVTSHNVVLKFAVEGGLLGLALIASLAVTAVKGAGDRLSDGPHTAAILALGGMGFTGAIVEASPISLALGIIIGLRRWKDP